MEKEKLRIEGRVGKLKEYSQQALPKEWICRKYYNYKYIKAKVAEKEIMKRFQNEDEKQEDQGRVLGTSNQGNGGMWCLQNRYSKLSIYKVTSYSQIEKWGIMDKWHHYHWHWLTTSFHEPYSRAKHTVLADLLSQMRINRIWNVIES